MSTPETALPVDSFRDAAPHLRRPFTAAAVKFKVQATWPKQNPANGLVVAYIDARLAVERLNLVCPHLWIDEYQPIQGGLLCRLTIDGLTRHDIGEGVGKGLYSDALKRAAVKFGVGVSLYAIPQSFIGVADGSAKPKQSGNGPTLVLTDVGERIIRDRYRTWLALTGTQAFGDPLDHGDVEGSQGDADAPGAQRVEEIPEPIDAGHAARLGELISGALAAGMESKQLLEVFQSAGADPERIDRAAVAALQPTQAEEIERVLALFISAQPQPVAEPVQAELGVQAA
jgi:hypothetical protein